MGCPRERAAIPAVFMALLFLQAGQAGVASCHPSPSAAVKHHQTAQDRAASSSNPRDAAASAMAYAVEQTEEVAPPDPCSESGVVVVSQGSAGSLSNGIPSYSVTIMNMCLGCTVRDIHVACGEFASTELVDPSDFRRLSYGDCLVKNGGPMGPGETISFEYSNSFIYKMDVATVSCGNILAS